MLGLAEIGYETGTRSHGVPNVGFDPNTWNAYVQMGAMDAAGVSIVFAVIVIITTGAVWVLLRRSRNQVDSVDLPGPGS